MDIYQNIKKDKLIFKFSFYGFFKNLKFFEPYLLIYLYGLGYNLFIMGVLMSIRASFTYLFEVPSAIVADVFGKRNTLLLSFVFYMTSFVFYFWAANFIVLALGMMFFGLGEAFRSGNHKAIILSYLEEKEWDKHKTYVYGLTRSYSLLGSSLSAFLSILFVLNLPVLKWIFLISIIPFLIDFILVASYPERLNEKQAIDPNLNIFSFGFKQIKGIVLRKNLIKVVMSSSIFDSIFKTIKDYIQPIFAILLASASMSTFLNFNADESLKIYLGILYGFFYIFSSFASRNVFRLLKEKNARFYFELMLYILAVSALLITLSVSMHLALVTMILFLILYVLKDARRPLFLDTVSDYMTKEERVTVLSIESQLTAMLMVAFAPIFGFVAEKFSIESLFLMIALFALMSSIVLKVKEKHES